MQKRPVIYVIKTLIIICLFAIAFLTWLLGDTAAWAIGFTAIGALLIIWAAVEYHGYLTSKRKPPPVYPPNPISCFALVSQEGGHEKEWHVSGATSFLIGKSTADTDVDIELGDTHYSKYVSNEHAVINFAAGCWYVEDTDSENGVGLRRRNEEVVYRLKPGKPYEICIGDVIHISKAKILVK